MLPLLAAAAAAGLLYEDPSAPVSSRVSDLLSRMTLDEKIAQLYATHTSAKTVERFTDTGVGAAKWLSAFSCGTNLTACVAQRNDLQKRFLTKSRLRIPITFINEGLHGGAPLGTVFPMPVNQGASWNVSLVAAIADVIAEQASAIGVHVVFAPVVNMMADPRFGRLQEGYSEEPTLTAHMGRAAVTALQGSDGGGGAASYYNSSRYVAALAKHFAAYGAAAGGLNDGPADVTNRTLHDWFLKPWRALAAAGVRATMASHQTVNDVPAHASRWLLHDSYRRSLGFDGVVLSDCNDIGVIADYGVGANATHAAAIGLHAGVDLDLQCGNDEKTWSYNKLRDAYSAGLTTEDDIDEAVRHVLTLKFASRAFDTPYTPTDSARLAELDSPAKRALAREAAQQGTVLLKNDGLLPLPLQGPGAPASIALIGPQVNNSGKEGAAMLGAYYLSPTPKVTTVADALRAAGFKGQLRTAQGCEAKGGPDAGAHMIPEAVAAAQQSDLALLVLGDLDGGCGEWGDRSSLDLQGGQVALLTAVAAVARRTAVVLIHGRPQTFGPGNAVLSNVSTLLAAFRPGVEGGSGIVDIISGAAVPSGKLPQSWPRNVGQVHGGASPWMQRIRGKWLANRRGTQDPDGRRYDDYVGDDPSPLFRFGAGLSYTTFAYESLAVTPAPGLQRGAGSPALSVNVTLRNSGKVAGVEVVQVYVQDPPGLPFVRFWKRLAAFARVPLAPGERRAVGLQVLWEDLAIHDADMTLRVVPGSYLVTAGGSSLDCPLQQTVAL